jgi:ribose transport system substrate-binding protein
MDRKYARLFAGAAALTLAVSSVGSALAQDGYTIGVSNTLQGNGWREEMICSIKAQGLVIDEVASLNIAHRNTDSAGQLEDIRNLIAADVDAIILNPADPAALDAAIAEAAAAGIPVISIDAAVTAPEAYNLSNEQTEYARLGARWLFEKLGGEGNVYYMRGLAGHPADDDRHAGFTEVLAEYPGITLVGGDQNFTGWDHPTGKQMMLDQIVAGADIDGVWTSGVDQVIVDAYVESEEPLDPIVGADNAGFVGYLGGGVEGFEGAAVTNPGTVGAAGVKLAVQILNGELPLTPPDRESSFVTVDPVLMANDTEEGQALIAAAQNPDIDPLWPVGLQIPGWTDYTDEQIIACQGPDDV